MAKPFDLTAHLPGGEWADIQIVPNTGGMMTARDWAVFARARWLRGGGRRAFVKFIVPADASAGDETNLVTSNSRLKQLYQRLSVIKGLGAAVPVVPLLEVRLTDAGLLIAMDEVQVLQSIVESGRGEEFAVQVLTELDPDLASGVKWLHFDICPKNVGVLGESSLVFIDVESLYLEETDAFVVSVPAWKRFRAPAGLLDAVESALAAGTLDRPLALRKINFEVLLACGECLFGPLPPSRGRQLDRAAIAHWLDARDPLDPVVSLMRTELEASVDGSARALREIASDLQVALKRRNVAAPKQVIAMAIETAEPAPGQSQSERTELALFVPLANALRAGQLDRPRIAEYRAALTNLVALHPQQAEVWDELLLVLISYEKDSHAALETVKQALTHLPDNPDLARLRDIILMWASDKK